MMGKDPCGVLMVSTSFPGILRYLDGTLRCFDGILVDLYPRFLPGILR